jgi:hypothetical protein
MRLTIRHIVRSMASHARLSWHVPLARSRGTTVSPLSRDGGSRLLRSGTLHALSAVTIQRLQCRVRRGDLPVAFVRLRACYCAP